MNTVNHITKRSYFLHGRVRFCIYGMIKMCAVTLKIDELLLYWCRDKPSYDVQSVCSLKPHPVSICWLFGEYCAAGRRQGIQWWEKSKYKFNTFFQIPAVTHLPVGRNLQDHAMLSLSVFIENTEASQVIDMNFRKISAMLQYFLFGKGKFKRGGIAEW